MRDPFVGLGPGRCGSNSLAHIVGACKNTDITHEKFVSNWYRHDDILEQLIAKMVRLSDADVLCGEVQCQMLPHFPYLRHEVGAGLKAVVLHRPREQFVESATRVLRPLLRPFDRVEQVSLEASEPVRVRVEWYPVIDAASTEQAWGFFWDLYETLSRTIQDPVLHLDTADLNDDAKIKELFDFLEIPESDRAIPEERNVDPHR